MMRDAMRTAMPDASEIGCHTQSTQRTQRTDGRYPSLNLESTDENVHDREPILELRGQLGWQFIGRRPRCGHCFNPFGLVRFDCPGWNTGEHDIWRLR